MTPRDEIIALAKECGFGNADVCEGLFYPNFERFFHAAQRQAYERAAEVCDGIGFDGDTTGMSYANGCAMAIRVLIEGEAK